MRVPALRLRQVATLDVPAASGLVLHRGLLHLVADDSARLHRYTTRGEPRAMTALFPRDPPLPLKPKARKKAKRDLEALALLPDGSLLALGSGSKERRRLGCRIAAGKPRLVDLTPVYETLDREFPRLNIEGAVIWNQSLVLAQRGNKGGSPNALVMLELDAALRDLEEGRLTGRGLHRIVPLRLGELDGVALSITDLATDSAGALCFSAAAEDTDNPCDDGTCMGSVVGELGPRFGLRWLAQVPGRLKIEGLQHARAGRAGNHWWMVADADNPDTLSPLLEAFIPRPVLRLNEPLPPETVRRDVRLKR